MHVKLKEATNLLSLVFLLINDLINGLRLHQLLLTKSTEKYGKLMQTELISKITNEKKD